MKTLLIAIYGTSPWIILAPGTKLRGSLVDAMECAFNRAEIPARLVVTPTARAHAMLASGAVDGLALAIRNSDRDARFVASAEISRSESGWFSIDPLADLTSAKFKEQAAFAALTGGSNQSRLLEQGYKIPVTVPGDTSDMLRMLAHGRFKVFFANRKVVQNELTKAEFASMKLNYVSHFADSIVAYFGHKSLLGQDAAALSRFNLALPHCPLRDIGG